MKNNTPYFINTDKNFQVLDHNLFIVKEFTNATNIISQFYQSAPFPNYEECETIENLAVKLENNFFLKNLKKQIGFNKNILEVGAGTCQLSLMLSHRTNNKVVAMDATLESINLGKKFAEQNNLKNCSFLNADIFSNPINDNSFDLIWCSGVLHHTKDPSEAFNIMTKWLKKDGIIILGLYNKYGRLRTKFRQVLFKLLGNKFGRKLVMLIDPYLRNEISILKKEAWINDQYKHPVESSHTMDEILRWYDHNGIVHINSIPSCTNTKINYENIFLSNSIGTIFSRIVHQIKMLFTNLGGEGGLFIMIGKKN